MIEAFTTGGVILLLILVFQMRGQIALMRRRIENLEATGIVPAARAEVKEPKVSAAKVSSEKSEPIKRTAKRISASAPDVQSTPALVKSSPADGDPHAVTPSRSTAKRFEDLIGGKLPIWIGGISLVFAGFFLVRFSIEAGLFGPTARCITAALFGLLLIGLAEFGYRIPKFGSIFTDDLRIGHSIAGAGIAVLYATLYMASELYGLLGLVSALIGVIAVTILAFILSQRHGPPTAIMGLVGGFTAPFVAGLGPESVAPLLIYLGVFTAGLFGLAIHRGWAWLALLATGGSIIWTTALLFMDVTGDIPFIGTFIVLLAIGGVLTISRIDNSYGIPKPVIQALPLIAGLLQLIMLAPLVEFSLMGWLFFSILAVFSITLAWRDEELTPAVAGSLGLAFAMVSAAYAGTSTNDIAAAVLDATEKQSDPVPAIGFAILFGTVGHMFANREKSGWMWAYIGLAAPTGMLIVTALLARFDWSDTIWGAASLLVAVNAGIMAWRIRASDKITVLPAASAITGLFLAIALWQWTPDQFSAIVTVAVAGALAAWARFTNHRTIAVESALASTLAGLMMLVSSAEIVSAVGASLIGETDLYSYLPEVGPLVIRLFVPALLVLALAYYYRETLGSRLAGTVMVIGLATSCLFDYLLFKQPLAIGPIEQFTRYGFAERAVLTHLLALAGWLLIRRPWGEKLDKPLKALAAAMAGLALFRFLYFDLFLLSPTSVKQALGPAPIANLGTVHYTAAAIWFWLFARSETLRTTLTALSRPLEIGGLFATVAAVMITVRQAVHGNDIATPPFTSTETYLYSAGLLVLAIVWLARGIQTTNMLLRIAGLLLLTLVTIKVFVIDAAQLDGVLRILSFLGLGIALLGIGWIYGKVMRSAEPAAE